MLVFLEHLQQERLDDGTMKLLLLHTAYKTRSLRKAQGYTE